MCKRQRAARTEDIGPGELRCGCGGSLRIQPGKSSRKLQVALLAQDRDGSGEGISVRAEAAKPPQDEARERLGPELADPSGGARGRLDLSLENSVDELVEEERVSHTRRVHRLHELLCGIAPEPVAEELSDGVGAEGSQTNDRGERLRPERVEGSCVETGFSRPNAGPDCDRKSFESAGEVGEEPQRRWVAPVDIVNGEQYRRP